MEDFKLDHDCFCFDGGLFESGSFEDREEDQVFFDGELVPEDDFRRTIAADELDGPNLVADVEACHPRIASG
jgi:hypothetical protein